MTEGIIFDIQRAGLYDGPGVRTVVFLKGCPLRCQWCHNPESQQRDPQISFRPEVCVLCGACAETCQVHAHTLSSGEHGYDRTVCVRCGECVSECAFEALQLAGRQMTVEQVLAEAERDRVYYEQSGGGLTLTGGEPMSQFSFTYELLAAAKAHGIHTCIETCGQAPAGRYQQILPLVDLFLFDYKATDPDEHHRLTGVDNRLIRANLDLLLASGARLWLRCPLVPGVNDRPEHLLAIAALEQQYPQIERIELMAYHNVGNDKYPRYGLSNPLPGLATTSVETKQSWLNFLQAQGSTRARLG